MKFIVKWQWKIADLCSYCHNYINNLQVIPMEIVGVPESQWQQLREDFISTQQLDGKKNQT